MVESTDALLLQAGALGALETDIVAWLPDGGAQLGIGVNLTDLDAATPLTLPPIYAVVIHAPTMFNNIPNFPKVLKTLIEQHAKSIQGIDFQYTLDTAETPAGHDGQQMRMPTNSKRSPVNPVFTFQEVTGNLVWNFFKKWIWMIKQPDTQASSLSATETDTLNPQLFSAFSMDILFLQFDATLRPENLIDAFFITAMFPTDTGMANFQRVIGQTEQPERQITFTGILQHNKNTKAVGQIVATALGIHRANYSISTPIAQSIETTLSDMGLEAEANDDANFTDLSQA